MHARKRPIARRRAFAGRVAAGAGLQVRHLLAREHPSFGFALDLRGMRGGVRAACDAPSGWFDQEANKELRRGRRGGDQLRVAPLRRAQASPPRRATAPTRRRISPVLPASAPSPRGGMDSTVRSNGSPSNPSRTEPSSSSNREAAPARLASSRVFPRAKASATETSQDPAHDRLRVDLHARVERDALPSTRRTRACRAGARRMRRC